MMRHLERLHIIEIKSKDNKDTTPKETKHGPLDNFVTSKTKYGMSHIRTKTLDNVLVKMIGKDMQPLSLVESEWFIKYSECLDPKYRLPGRKVLTKKLIPREYDRLVNKVRSEIKNSTGQVSLTTDSWTSRTAENYVTVTVHFMDKNWAIKSYRNFTAEKITHHCCTF